MIRRALAVACTALVLAAGMELVVAQRLRFIMPASAQAEGLSSGDIVIRVSGECGTGFTEVAALDGKVIRGTVAANMNQGGTGGSDTVTPEGTVAQATFTGSALSGHAHGTGTYATSAHSGSAVDDHASHTHAATGLTFTGDAVTASETAATPNLVTSSTQGGAVSPTTTATGTIGGTTAGPSATLSHAVTQPSAHTLSGSSESVSGGTPAGTINAQSFTGTEHSTLPAYTRVLFCSKD